MKRKWLLGPVVLLLALGGGVLARRAATPGTEHTFAHAGRERIYRLVEPAAKEGMLPLVVLLHGGGGHPANILRTTDMDQLARREGFLLAVPGGAGKLKRRFLTWNVQTCCGYSQKNGIDDVGYVAALVRHLIATKNVDPKRVYATGLSNGGMLSYRLACEASGLFAAVAPVAASHPDHPCKPKHPVSVLGIHGSDDQHVLFNGGVGPKGVVKENRLSQKKGMVFWAKHNGCDVTPKKDRKGDMETWVFTGCRPGAEVRHMTAHGMGHAWPGGKPGWPGGDKPSQAFSANDVMWNFFTSHPKR